MRDVLDALKGVKPSGDGWIALCPAHPDARHSLSLGKGDDGRWLVKCHAGCETRAVVDAAGLTLADLMPDRNGDTRSTRRVLATYDYHDAGGALVYQVLRYEPKDFRQRRPDGAGGWVWDLKGVARVLYRLPQLAGQSTAWIVEGEKDADRLWAAGLVATTKAGGATGWEDEFTAQLVAAGVTRVWCVPDHDAPGEKFMARVVASCVRAGLHASCVTLPGVPAGGDVSDYLVSHGVADLLALTRHAAPPAPSDETQIQPVADGLTETSHAERFAIAYSTELRFDHRRGIWICYEAGRWRPDATEHVRRHAIAFVRSRQRDALEIDDPGEKKKHLRFLTDAEKKVGIDRLVQGARSLNPMADPGTDWDADPWLMGTPDGIINLKTGESRPGDPADRVTFSAAFALDPAATCPIFQAFLTQVFEGEPGVIDFLQRFIGYSLTGSTIEQVLVLCHGRGANGKSTLLNTLRRVLGDYAHNLPFSSLEMKDRGGIPNDMAALAGRRFVVASETTEGSRLNEGRIKALTGGDPVTARFLHGEWFTFEPQAKFLLSVNHKPEVTDETVSLWRRILLVPFLRTFTGSACDPNLPAALIAEAPGILAWAVRGCLLWQESGLKPPACVYDATHAYQAESDVLLEFIDAMFEVDPVGDGVKAAVLQDLYTKWADRERIPKRERLSAKKLSAKMADRTGKVIRRDGSYYTGLRVSTGQLW